MRHHLIAIIAVGTALLSSLGWACGASPLTTVLEFIPLEVEGAMVLFTNWANIKNYMGLGLLTSESPLDQRIELLSSISQDQAAASAYGLSYARSHAEEWGWDTADLDWEANIVSRNLPPTYILKFRDGFDFTPVLERFVERGFTQTESYSAQLFSHELDVRVAWIRTTELSILTTAYLASENMLILSSFGVDAYLATAAGELPSLAEDIFAMAALGHFTDPYSAILVFGLGECIRFTSNPLIDLLGTSPTSEKIAELREMVAERQLLVPYRAFGIGYWYMADHPTGAIAFEYDTPELAETELPARCTLAKEGMSAQQEAPIEESYFTVLDCSVQGSAVIISVSPLNDQPWRLLRPILYRDAVFAGCSY